MLKDSRLKKKTKMRGFSLTHWGVKYSSKQEQNSELRTCTQLYYIYVCTDTYCGTLRH